ncbi:hypothetical protein RM780_00680 [Streptomyces sp. DSM 44917]|uniref:CBM6 domain-containing protein n=1 Tax=Streptomyces boetiae TaxID=3075541 RepID=A0ABU2L1P2_9ACTN|nr:hypothetical protein [Streptomyces sp. DSM 44917]MDT0305481.1 hypothetical protein [Streptomyces sp. DSM 44917]
MDGGARTSGNGEDEDPFAYLYRPEGGQGGATSAQPAPRPASYHHVRPVGERTFGGAQGVQGTQASPAARRAPDAHYAAPETQVGAPPPHRPGQPRRRSAPADPRRNGLLIGALAVVLAVVLGVGAAIVFSGGEEEPNAGGQGTGTPTDGGDDEPDGGEEPSQEPTDETPPGELPVADLTSLELANGASRTSGIGGARSEDGSYIAIQGAPNSTVTWTFDVEEAGQYRLYTGYSVITDGQGMSFSVNGTPREDPVNMRNFNSASQEWDGSWTSTWNLVDLQAGQNTVQYTCTSACDVIIDYIGIVADGDAAPL